MKITLTSHFTRFINQNSMLISGNTTDKIYSKKLPLASTTTSWRLGNLLQVLATISLFKLVNTAIILAFSLSLMLCRVLVVSRSTLPNKLLSRWLQSGESDSQLWEVMQLQKFSHSKNWVFLFMWHSAGSFSQTLCNVMAKGFRWV